MKGQIEKRGERLYRLRLFLGHDAAGKRLTRSETVRGTRRDAQKRLTELLAEIETSGLKKPTDYTVAEYLDYWLEHYVSQLAERTGANYRDYVRYYLKPALGRHRLDQLTPAEIQRFVTNLSKQTKRSGELLSPTTVHHAYQVLRGALKRAVRWQFIARNPAEAVDAPAIDQQPFDPPTQEQLTQFLTAAADSRHFLPILLALCTGMRRGECAGLRWQDVDLEKSLLTVQQTRIVVTTGKVITKVPKSRSGRRSIPLPSVLVEALREAHERNEVLRKEFGPSYNGANLVICQENGEPYNPRSLYRAVVAILQKEGLPPFSFHALRHCHATQLLEQGVHVKTVSERLGHSDPALTLRVYSHALQHIQREAAEHTDTHFRQVLGRPKSEPTDPA